MSYTFDPVLDKLVRIGDVDQFHKLDDMEVRDTPWNHSVRANRHCVGENQEVNGDSSPKCDICENGVHDPFKSKVERPTQNQGV